jgi:hypothetical protein
VHTNIITVDNITILKNKVNEDNQSTKVKGWHSVNRNSLNGVTLFNGQKKEKDKTDKQRSTKLYFWSMSLWRWFASSNLYVRSSVILLIPLFTLYTHVHVLCTCYKYWTSAQHYCLLYFYWVSRSEIFGDIWIGIHKD